MRRVAGTLRLALSQFRDLEAFAAFASDLDAASRAQLDRGARLVELLKQPQYTPYPVEEQVVAIFLGTHGHLDDVGEHDVQRFERDFLDQLRSRHGNILTSIKESKALSDDDSNALDQAVADFKRGFDTHAPAAVNEPEAHPLEGEAESESVKVYRPKPAR
jgi:F-type H+-transporting ATPase subunit alpha